MSVTAPPQLRLGSVAFDDVRGMVCVLWALDGEHAEVARPTGPHWRTRIASLRPATPPVSDARSPPLPVSAVTAHEDCLDQHLTYPSEFDRGR